MKNTFTETKTTSYGQGVKNSLGGVIAGIIIFILSFVLLWFNEENCVRLIHKEDFINKNAIAVNSNMVNRSNDTKLIATNGSVYTDETLSDSMVTVGKALNLARTVEMYQWVEKQHTQKHRTSNGGLTETTTYSYEQKWDKTEHNSDKFKKTEYNNPKFTYKSKLISANSGTMGDFKLDKNQIAIIGNYQDIEKLEPVKDFKIIDSYYYKGHNYSSPEIGDIRISYKYVPSGADVSIIGQQNWNNTIGEMTTRDDSVYLQYDGILSLKDMLNRYNQSNTLLTFGVRFLGFILMFIGLQMLVNPIIAIARFVPYLSEITEFISSFLLLAIALILSLLTIAVAWLVYRPILAISLLIVTGIIIYYIRQYIKNKRSTRLIPDEPV